MALSHETDHASAAAARGVQRLKSNDAWLAFIALFVKPVQTLEDALWQLWTTQWLNGSNYQLEQVGELLDETRDGDNDLVYLARLRAKIRVLRSSGGPLDLLKIFKLLVPSNTIYFSLLGGAAYILELGVVDSQYAPVFRHFASLATAAGVGYNVHYSPSNAFRMALGGLMGAKSAGATSLAPITSPNFLPGDLVSIGAGLATAELRIIDADLNVTALANDHAANEAVSILRRDGDIYTVAADASSGDSTLVVNETVRGGKTIFTPFSPLLVDPGLPTQERLIVSSVNTSTNTITFTLTLAHDHATGCFLIFEDERRGFGSDGDTAGGLFSSVIVGS